MANYNPKGGVINVVLKVLLHPNHL